MIYHATIRAVRRLALFAAALAVAAFGPGIDLSQDTSTGFAITDACADGSCGPANDFVCGLNGQNYENKVYVPDIT